MAKANGPEERERKMQAPLEPRLLLNTSTCSLEYYGLGDQVRQNHSIKIERFIVPSSRGLGILAEVGFGDDWLQTSSGSTRGHVQWIFSHYFQGFF